MSKTPRDKADSINRLKEQYIQAHLAGNTVLKKLIESILRRIGEAPPRI